MRQWLERLTAVALAGFLLASPLAAQNLTDDLVGQLREQGFHKVTITRTLLGRVLILGSSDEGQREIVLNPKTGEILRDYFRPRQQMAMLPSNSGDRLTSRPTPDNDNDGGSDQGDDKGGRGNGGVKVDGKGGTKGEGKGGAKGDGKGGAKGDGKGAGKGDGKGTGDSSAGGGDTETGDGDTGTGDDGGGRGSEPGGKTPQTDGG